jgi:hypothetical protein
MADSDDPVATKIQLYGMLIDQIHRYAAIFWQFPLGLIAANTLAWEEFQKTPILLAIVAVLDFILVYAFQVAVVHSRALVLAAQRAEEVLRKEFPDFIPTFVTSKIKATRITVAAMWAIPCGMLIYAFVTAWQIHWHTT